MTDTSWGPNTEVDERGYVTRTDPATGNRFEFDPKTGKSALFNADGTYFRSTDDYDHGWVFKTPDMPKSKLRRSKASIFVNRAMTVFQFALVILYPPFLAAILVPWFVALPLMIGYWGLITWFFTQKRPFWQANMFQYSWNGYLSERI